MNLTENMLSEWAHQPTNYRVTCQDRVSGWTDEGATRSTDYFSFRLYYIGLLCGILARVIIYISYRAYVLGRSVVIWNKRVGFLVWYNNVHGAIAWDMMCLIFEFRRVNEADENLKTRGRFERIGWFLIVLFMSSRSKTSSDHNFNLFFFFFLHSSRTAS